MARPARKCPSTHSHLSSLLVDLSPVRTQRVERAPDSRSDRGRPTKPWLVGPCDPRYINRGGVGARLTRLIAATIPTYNPYRSRVSAVLTGSSTTSPTLCHHRPPSPWPAPGVPRLDKQKVGSPDLILPYTIPWIYQIIYIEAVMMAGCMSRKILFNEVKSWNHFKEKHDGCCG